MISPLNYKCYTQNHKIVSLFGFYVEHFLNQEIHISALILDIVK